MPPPPLLLLLLLLPPLWCKGCASVAALADAAAAKRVSGGEGDVRRGQKNGLYRRLVPAAGLQRAVRSCLRLIGGRCQGFKAVIGGKC
jgi:hypothetical protein